MVIIAKYFAHVIKQSKRADAPDLVKWYVDGNVVADKLYEFDVGIDHGYLIDRTVTLFLCFFQAVLDCIKLPLTDFILTIGLLVPQKFIFIDNGEVDVRPWEISF